jgi:hypothetical protein
MKNALFWDIITQFVPHRKHYVSVNEPSGLMLRKTVCLYGGDYEECRILGCDVMWLWLESKFRKNVPPPSSGALGTM